MSHNEDAFAGGDRTPALSMKGSTPGTSWTVTVTGPAKLVQTKDFDTDEPAFWDEEKTQPKMAAVVPGVCEGAGVSVWATKPSSLFTAIATAQREAGTTVAKGGTLVITHTGNEPAKNKKFNDKKLYAAKYTAPSAFGSDDAPF